MDDEVDVSFKLILLIIFYENLIFFELNLNISHVAGRPDSHPWHLFDFKIDIVNDFNRFVHFILFKEFHAPIHHNQEFVLSAVLFNIIEFVSGVNSLSPILQSGALHMNTQKARVLSKESNQENQLCRIATVAMSKVQKYLN